MSLGFLLHDVNVRHLCVRFGVYLAAVAVAVAVAVCAMCGLVG